jgi:CubicO group peptidase (beta-lactamase class C family)
MITTIKADRWLSIEYLIQNHIFNFTTISTMTASVFVLCVLLLPYLASASVGMCGTNTCECGCGIVPPVTSVELPTIMNDIIQQRVAEMQEVQRCLAIPSFYLSIVWRNQTIYSSGFGSADAAGGPPPTSSTLFPINSVSKTFTCALLMTALDRGNVTLDDEAAIYLPGFNPQLPLSPINPSRPARGITLRQLASHTSGLPRYGNCPGADCLFSTAEGIAEANRNGLMFRPGSSASYSNIGMSLLGAAVAAAMGYGNTNYTSFAQAVKENIFEPLGMEDATYDGSSVVSNLSVGLDPAGQPAPAPTPKFDIPSGGVVISPRDMERFLKLLVSYDSPRGASQPIDGAVVEEWVRTIQFAFPDSGWGSDTSPLTAHAYGMPWEIERRHGKWMMAKDGAGSGWNTQIGVLPDQQLSIAMFSTKCCNAELLGNIAGRTRELLFDLGDALNETYAAAAAQNFSPGQDPASIVGTYALNDENGVPAAGFNIEFKNVSGAVGPQLVVSPFLLFLIESPVVLSHAPVAESPLRYTLTTLAAYTCRAQQSGILGTYADFHVGTDGIMTVEFPLAGGQSFPRISSVPSTPPPPDLFGLNSTCHCADVKASSSRSMTSSLYNRFIRI